MEHKICYESNKSFLNIEEKKKFFDSKYPINVADLTKQQGEDMGRRGVFTYKKYQPANQTPSVSYVWGRF